MEKISSQSGLNLNNQDLKKIKDFRAVNPKYDQDSINGITEVEYTALLEYLKAHKNISSVLDLCGGSGKLTKRLMEEKYDAHLCDIADNMIHEAISSGVPEEKTMIVDLLSCDIANKFDAVVLKSAMHEFSKEKMNEVHVAIYKVLNDDGVFVDLDVHQPNQDCAEWLKKWVNLKDEIAGLELLVKNRAFYTVDEIKESLLQNGFKDVSIVHEFNYTVSANKFCEMYWNNDERKTELFHEETRKMILGKPDDIIITEVGKDFIVKLPAVILAAKK